MFKNIRLTDVLIIIIGGILIYNSFFKETDKEKPIDITVNIPEVQGSTGTQYVEPKVIVVPINNGKNNDISVDSYWKERYENANQRIKDSLYNEAIKINKYNDTLIDDKYVTIKGDFTTRGSLLDYKVDYIRKEFDITYTPETVVENPKLSLNIRQGLLAPSPISDKFNAPFQIGLENKKGWEIGYIRDLITQQNGGYVGKTFTILK